MTFTIPNVTSAPYAAQAQMDSVDLTALLNGFARTGVVSGCGVTAQGTPNMTVAVASGTILSNNVAATVAGGNLTIAAADSVLARFDLIVASSAGVLSVVQGTSSLQPVFPVIPANSAVLAVIYVPANTTAITSALITDKSVVLAFTANSGTGSVSAATSVTINHGLSAAPLRVFIDPTSDPGAGIRWWVSAKGATTFTITFSASASFSFDWRAQLTEG